MIAIFRTNVDNEWSARRIIRAVIKNSAVREINFDLEDCDRILRIVTNGKPVDESWIISLVGKFGYSACLL